MKILLSIVSHNQFILVKELLQDLKEQLLDHSFTIILTSNISEDLSGLDDFIDLPLFLVKNDIPLGFGANHNRAFNIMHSDLFIILNPDLRIFRADFNIYEFIEHAVASDANLTAPMITNNLGIFDNNFRYFPTFLQLVIRFFIPWVNFDKDYDSEINQNIILVDWVAGMFIAFKSSAFKSLGGFDERYHMYMEDVDICNRMEQKYSKKCVVFPKFKIVHNAQRASRKKIRNLIWHITSCLKYFYRKYSGFN